MDRTGDQVGSVCEGETGAQLVMCPNPVPCPTTPFYKYTPFGACDATCDACTDRRCDVPGNKTRGAACMQDDGTGLVGSTNCTEAAILTQECTKTCTTPPLRFIKTEGPCVSSGCGVNGTRTVTYTPCTAGRGCKIYPEMTTNAVTTSTAECPGLPCDGCAAAPCVAENTLSSTTDNSTGLCTCTCADGFIGSRCHLASGTAYSILDSSGMVCLSGVTDVDGNCCGEGIGLDGCGYCSDIAVDGLEANRVGFDLDGQCCSGSNSTVFMTGDFTCCASFDLLDECGVCNGSGDTCEKMIDGTITSTSGGAVSVFSTMLESSLPSEIQAQLLVPGESARRLLQSDVTESVQYTLVAGSSMSTVELAGTFISTGVEASTGASPLLSVAPSVPTPSTAGVVGDGICGSGETPDTSSDCLAPQACPVPVAVNDIDLGTVFVGSPTADCSGNGVCVTATGECMCNLGYTGSACDECDVANSYTLVPTSVEPPAFGCSQLSNDFPPGTGTPDGPAAPGTPPVAGSPTTPPAGTSTTDEKKKGLGMGALIGIIVGAVGGVVVIAGGAFFVLRMRAGKEVSPV